MMASMSTMSGWGSTALLLGAGAAAWFLLVVPHLEEDEALRAQLESARAQNQGLQSKLQELESNQAELAAEKAVTEQALAAMRRTQEELHSRLENEVKKGNVMIAEQQGEIVVDLIDKIVFDSGKAEVNDTGKEVLEQVGETLKKVPDRIIQVAGHTDNLNISKNLIETFPTNWELSTARATNVVRFFQEELEIPGERLAAAGYAAYQPIGNNKTKAGRQRNRRIEVRLLPIPQPRTP